MTDPHDMMAAYRAETTPSPEQLDRVARGVARPKRSRAAVVVAGGLALAAAAAWFVAMPRSVDRSLSDAGEVPLGRRVTVNATGDGSVVGTTEAMHIAWNKGTLDVDVAPRRGIRLEVETPEALVRVVGTQFDVTRDALGTRVRVRRGEVEVTCRLEGVTSITAGDEQTCRPMSASGGLLRVLTLEGNVDADVLVKEIDAALSRPDAEGPVRGELLAVRTRALVEAGRLEEALTTAEGALQQPSSREIELRRTAAHLRLRVEDCAGALPHLLALDAAGAIGEDSDWLAWCRGR